MGKNKTIEVLNKLIQVNNDRIEGYETAFGETTDISLKALFTNCIDTSKLNNKALVFEVEKLDGKPIFGTKSALKLLKIWMNVKAFLTNRCENTILKSCVFGENIAISIYQKVLQKHIKSINTQQNVMIIRQLSNIMKDNSQVKSKIHE